MPPAWLECEICGRTGNVIPCVHSERCQRGRCLICHTGILGQQQFYDTAYDIILTCDSCNNYTDGCVVKDEHIPALKLRPGAAKLLEYGVVGYTEQQKRPCPEGTSSITKRHKVAAATTPEPIHADDAALPDAGRKARSLTSASPGKEKSPAPRKEKSPAKQRAADTQQQRQSTAVLQPSRLLAGSQSQQHQQQQQGPRLAKPLTLKRPVPAAQPGVDAPPGKRLAMPGQKQLKASADTAKLPHQQHDLAQQQQSPASERKGGHDDTVVCPSGTAKGSGVSTAEAAAAAALGRMVLPKQQQSGTAGSASRSHSQATGSQQAAKPLVAASRPQYKQSQVQQLSQRGGTTSASAAALASKVAANRPPQEPHSSSDAGRPGRNYVSADLQAKPAVGGVAMQQRLKLQHASSVGKSSRDGDGSQNPAVRSEPSQHQQSTGSKPNMARAGPVICTADGNADTEAGTVEAEKSALQGATKLSLKGVQTKSQPPMHKPKPFSLSGIKVGENMFDGISPGEDNIIPDEANEQPAHAVQGSGLHAADAVQPRRTSNARNQDGWAGRASIELDAMVELDLRVVPQAGVPLPPLLEDLKYKQDTSVDGAIVSKAVMDTWATRERSQGSNLKLTANFSKVLVTLKERPFGQGKQLHSVLRQMVEAKKYLRLYSGSRSVFFAPVLRSRAAETHNMELMDYNVVLLNKHDDIAGRSVEACENRIIPSGMDLRGLATYVTVYDLFEVVCKDQLGVVYHLTADEDLPTSKSVQFVEVQVEAGSSVGGKWNRRQTAVKSNLKKETSKPVIEPIATDVAATTAPPMEFGGTALGEDDDEDHDNWLDDSSFGVAVKPGFGATLGSLGLGMGATASNSAFTTMDHVTHAGYVVVAGDALPTATFGASNGALSWQQGLGAMSATSIAAVTSLGLGANTSPYEDVLCQSHGLTDIATRPAIPPVGSHGASPTTPDQQQPPTPPVEGLQRQSSFVAQGVIANVLHGKGTAKKNKLMPSVDGLCKWFANHGMRQLKVHIHGTLVDHNQDKAELLKAWMTAQGATVTMYPVDPTPGPGHVNMIVVYSRHVVDMGMEGKEALPVNKYLVAGAHVVSELFIEGLQQSNLSLTSQALESDKKKRHWQFFASGVNLLLDNTLLKYSKRMLPELMEVLKAVATCMGPHVVCKAFRGRGMLELDQLSKHNINTWEHEGVLQVLPKEYVSITPKPGMPQAVRDAIKAMYNIHKREETLRYMIVVVPDFDDNLAEDDLQHVETVLKASTDQKTIYAATVTDTIAFLRILSCVDSV